MTTFDTLDTSTLKDLTQKADNRPGEGFDYIIDGESGLIPLPTEKRTTEDVAEICKVQSAFGKLISRLGSLDSQGTS